MTDEDIEAVTDTEATCSKCGHKGPVRLKPTKAFLDLLISSGQTAHDKGRADVALQIHQALTRALARDEAGDMDDAGLFTSLWDDLSAIADASVRDFPRETKAGE